MDAARSMVNRPVLDPRPSAHASSPHRGLELRHYPVDHSRGRVQQGLDGPVESNTPGQKDARGGDGEMFLEELDLSSSSSGAAEEALFLRKTGQEKNARFREISGRETQMVQESRSGHAGVTVAVAQVEERDDDSAAGGEVAVAQDEAAPFFAAMADGDGGGEEEYTYSECENEQEGGPAEDRQQLRCRSDSNKSIISGKNGRIANSQQGGVGEQETRQWEQAFHSGGDIVDGEAIVSADTFPATCDVAVSANAVSDDGQKFGIVHDAGGELSNIAFVSRSVHDLLPATPTSASVSVSSSLDGASPFSPLRGESIGIRTVLLAPDETPVSYTSFSGVLRSGSGGGGGCDGGGGGDDDSGDDGGGSSGGGGAGGRVAQNVGTTTLARSEPSTARKILATKQRELSPCAADGENNVATESGGTWAGVGNAAQERSGRLCSNDDNIVIKGGRCGVESGVGCLTPGSEESSTIGDTSATAVGGDVASVGRTPGPLRLEDRTETLVIHDYGTDNNRRRHGGGRLIVVAESDESMTEIRGDDDVVAPVQLSAVVGTTSRSHDWRRWVMKLGKQKEEEEKRNEGGNGCIEADNVADRTLRELEEELRWIRGALESRVRVRREERPGGEGGITNFTCIHLSEMLNQ